MAGGFMLGSLTSLCLMYSLRKTVCFLSL